jgi:hypothetical protein
MEWYMNKEYVRKHLVSYFEFQLKQGYELDDIKKALAKYGYDQKLLDEISNSIDPDVYRPPKTKPSIKELNEDLYVYLQNMLVDYIRKELSQGYEIEVIRKALIKYGHHATMVNSAVKAAQEGTIIDIQPQIKLPGGLVFTLAIALILAFIMALVIKTDSTIGTVSLGFSPALIAVLATYALFLNVHEKRVIQMLPLLAVVISVVSFVVMARFMPAMAQLSEPQTIVLLNALLAFVPSSMICLLSKRRPRVYSVREIENSPAQET